MKIIIYGFTGSGKTTYLEKLKNDVDLSTHNFIDLDSYIFNKHAKGLNSLAELIDLKGWVWFRQCEESEFKHLLTLEKVVLSLGGGSVSLKLIEYISNFNDIYGVYLNESFVTCWNRIKNDPSRPIVFNGEEKCKVLYNKRKKLFQKLEKTCLKL